MRTLETEFTFHGHLLKQIWRRGYVAIYERSRNAKKPPHELELIIVRVKPETKMFGGVIVPEHEAYPSASEWGRIAWSFPVREKAFVNGLAEKLLAIRSGYGALVRRLTSEYMASK